MYGKCYYHVGVYYLLLLADVTTNILCMADVVATCYGCILYQFYLLFMSLRFLLADVIAMMWKMLNHI